MSQDELPPLETDEQGRHFYWGACLVLGDRGMEVRRIKIIMLPPAFNPRFRIGGIPKEEGSDEQEAKGPQGRPADGPDPVS
jgi:hypothetical protein